MHGCIIVALSPAEIEEHGGVEEAVDWNMAPFDENDEWCADGSRWDYWTIGGRYSGQLVPDYDPREVPENWQSCRLCNGSGKRDDAVGREARRTDPAFTCNGCRGKGRALKDSSEWRSGDDMLLRSKLTEEDLRAAQQRAARKLWASWQAEKCKDDRIREDVYGLRKDETLESLVARYGRKLLSAAVFLKNRRWCENERLAWFGDGAATECDLEAEERGEVWSGCCITRDEETGSSIATFHEEEDDWEQRYWRRFIQDLPPDTTLVAVDYHV
jgi:hypothetical protein